jgi:hypothetical protein
MDWQGIYESAFQKTFFISYKSENKDLASAVCRALESRGQRVWRDAEQLRTGDLWWNEIERALASCDDVVLLLSREALTSEVVLRELSAAVRLNRLIHVFTETSLRESAPAVYQQIGDFHHAPFSTDDPVEATTEAIVSEVMGERSPVHPVNPFTFFKHATIRIFPDFSILAGQAPMPANLVGRYRSYELLPYPRNCANALLSVNFGLLAAHQSDWDDALGHFQACSCYDGFPSVASFFALSLLRGYDPRVVDASDLDKVVDLLDRAFRVRKSPLIGCLFTWVLERSGRARGPNLTKTKEEAWARLSIEPDSERARFRSLTKGLLRV